jgi:hypothetical protein
LDGFTIKQTATSASIMMSTIIATAGSRLSNCIFNGSNLTYTSAIGSTNSGCLINTVGTVKNCLITDNTVSVTYSNADIKIVPFLNVTVPTTSITASIDGCVFRNNKATITNSLYTTAALSNLRGLVINISDNGTSNSAGTKSVVSVSNCLVYNNECAFTGNGSYLTAPHATIAGTLSFSANNTTNSFVHCTFANNKMTNMLSTMEVKPAGNAGDYLINIIENNVFWNNKNTLTASSTTSTVSVNSSSAQYAGTVFSNNYMDILTTGTWGASLAMNANLTNLNSSNSGTNAPEFVNPTLTVGNTIDGTSQLSNWKISSSSSLIGKGVTNLSYTTDLAGEVYAATPAVGAYEYIPPVPTILNQNEKSEISLITVKKDGIVSNTDGLLQVISFSGVSVLSKKVVTGEVISLPIGAYVIKISGDNGSSVVKVII